MRYIFLFFLLALSASVALAQHQQVLHQTFQLDSLQELSLDLYDEYQIEPWAGDAILLETTVQLYDASSGILEFLVENDRYKVDADTLEATTGLHLYSVKKERKAVRTSKGECYEVVKVRVFLPDSFLPAGTHKWVAPPSSDDAPANPVPAAPKAIPADTTQIKTND
jgi:hypothetical protein